MPSLLSRVRSLLALGIVAVLLTGCGGPNLAEMWSDPLSLGICGLIAFILALIAIVEVAGSRRSTGGKVLWILVLLLLPYLGAILYYLFADRS